AVAPPDFKLDGNQAETFVNQLKNLLAVRFLAPKDTPKTEEAKLDPKAGALAIEITVEGEKAPLQLTIGGTDPENKNFYATSAQMPGEVFLVLKDLFENVKANPEYFAKK